MRKDKNIIDETYTKLQDEVTTKKEKIKDTINKSKKFYEERDKAQTALKKL